MMQRVVTIFLIAFVFASCSSDDDIVLRELNTNRQLWEASQIKNYSWNERLSCECGGVLERDIFVVNGVKDRIEFDEADLPVGVTYDDIFQSARSVEEVFTFIESILSEDVASLFISYDDMYGYPRSIGIDYNQEAIDDEIVYTYSKFEITN